MYKLQHVEDKMKIYFVFHILEIEINIQVEIFSQGRIIFGYTNEIGANIWLIT